MAKKGELKKVEKKQRGIKSILKEVDYQNALALVKDFYLNCPDLKHINWETACNGIYLDYRRELIWYQIRCGCSKRVIYQMLQETFGICKQSCRTWYRDAIEAAITDRETNKDEVKEIVIEQHNMILRKCLEDGNYRDALSALNQLNKITGIYEPEEVKVEDVIRFKFGE